MPNQIVDHYRRENPGTGLSDDEITLYYAEEYSDQLPQLLQQYPDFASDYQTIYREAFPLTAGDKAAQAGRSLIGGIAGTIGSIPEAVGILQSETLGRLGVGPRDYRETLMGQLAEGVRGAGESVSPEVPRRKAEQMADSFWLSKAPGALGSGVGFIGMGGIAGKVAQSALRKGIIDKAEDVAKKTVTSSGGVMTGGAVEASRKAAQKAGQQYVRKAQQRINTGTIAALGSAANAAGGYKDAMANGATPDQAVASYLLNGIVGTSEAIPLGRILNRLDTASGGTFMYYLGNATVETFEEALQEALQGAAGDIIAANIVQYDPDREMFAGLEEDAAAGGVSGAILSLIASAINRKVSKLSSEENPVGVTGAELNEDGQVDPRVEQLFTTTADVARAAYSEDPQKLEAIENLARRTAANIALETWTGSRLQEPRTEEDVAKETLRRSQEATELRAEYNELIGSDANADIIFRTVLFKEMHRGAADSATVSVKSRLAEMGKPLEQVIPGLGADRPEQQVPELDAARAGTPVERTEAPTVAPEVQGPPAPPLGPPAPPAPTPLGPPAPMQGPVIPEPQGPPAPPIATEDEPTPELQGPQLPIGPQLPLGTTSLEQQGPQQPSISARKKALRNKKLGLGSRKRSLAKAKKDKRPKSVIEDKEFNILVAEEEIAKLEEEIQKRETAAKFATTTEASTNNAVQSIIAGANQVKRKAQANLKLAQDKVNRIESDVAGLSKEDRDLKLNITSGVNEVKRLQRQNSAIPNGLESRLETEKAGLEKELAGKNNPRIVKGFNKRIAEIQGQIDKNNAAIKNINGQLQGFTDADIQSGEATVKVPEGTTTQQVLNDYTTAAQQVADAEVAAKNADENNPLSVVNVDVDGSKADKVLKAGPAYYEFGKGTTVTATTQFAQEAEAILEEYEKASEEQKDVFAGLLATHLARGSNDNLSSTTTRRQIAFKSPDGRIWVLGLHRGGKGNKKYMVVPPGASVNDKNYEGVLFSEILRSGFVPFAAIRFKVGVPRFNQVVDNIAEYKALSQYIIDEVQTTPAYLGQVASLGSVSNTVSLETFYEAVPEEFARPDSEEGGLGGTPEALGTYKDEPTDEDGVKIMPQSLVASADPVQVVELAEGVAELDSNQLGFIFDIVEEAKQTGNVEAAEQVIDSAIYDIAEFAFEQGLDQDTYQKLIRLGLVEYSKVTDKLKQIVVSLFNKHGKDKQTFIDGASRDGTLQSFAETLQAEAAKPNRLQIDQADRAVDEQRFAPERPATIYPRVPQDKLNRIFNFLIERMKALGVQVEITDKEFANAATQARAMFGVADGKPVIVLAMNSLENPSIESLFDLLHEIGHAATDNLSPDQRAKVLDAISTLKDSTLNIEGRKYKFDTDAQVADEAVQEERLVEALATALINNEFDPTTANTIASKIVQFFRNILTAVKQAFHRMTGNQGQVAMNYFRLQVEAMLTGNHPPKYLSYISGYKSTISDKMSTMDMVDSDSLVDTIYNLKDKTVRFKEVVGDSPEAVEHNIRFTKVMFAPDRSAYSDVDLAAARMEAQRVIATNNALNDILKELYATYRRQVPVDRAISLEVFINKLTNNRLPDDRIKKALELSQDPELANTQIQDLETEEARPRAAEALDELLRKVEVNLEKMYIEAETQLSYDIKSSAVNKHKEIQIKLLELSKEYENLTAVQSTIVEFVDGLIRGRADQSDIMLESALKEMGVTVTSDDIKYARKRLKDEKGGMIDALERLATEVANSPDLANNPWRNANKIQQLIEKLGDPLLDIFNVNKTGAAAATKQQRAAALAVAISVGRKNKTLMSLLALRREENIGQWKTAFKTALTAALDGNPQKALSGFRSKVEGVSKEGWSAVKLGAFAKITSKAEAALKALEEAKGLSRDYAEQRDKAQRESKIYENTIDPLKETQEKVGTLFNKENILPDWFQQASQGGAEWAAVHGALYIVPPNPQSSVSELRQEGNRRNLNLKDIKDIGQLVKDIEAMNAWLQNQPAEQRGGEYNMIKRMVDRMTEIQAVQFHRELSNSFVVKMMGSLTDMLEQVGSPAANKIAAQLKRFAYLIASYAGSGGKSAVRSGKVWSQKLTEAMNAVNAAGGNYDLKNFKAIWYSEAMQFFHHRRDIMNDAPNRSVGEDRLIEAWLNAASKIPRLKPIVAGARNELRAFYKQTAESSRMIADIGDKMGVMVYESDGQYFRNRIGSSLTTSMRQTNSTAKAVYEAIKGVFQEPKAVSVLTEMSPEEFNNYIFTRYSDGRVMREFVSPLIARPGQSVFYDENGVPLPQQMVERAFNANANDMRGFLDTLMSEANISPEDAPKFQAQIINRLDGFFGKLQSIITKSDESNGFLGGKSSIPIHVMMDARKFNDFPSEWVEYAEFTERRMYQYVKNLSAESAFGRDLVQVNNDFALATSDMDRAVSMHEKIEEKIGQMSFISRITPWGRKRYQQRYDNEAKEMQEGNQRYTGKFLRSSVLQLRQLKKLEAFFKSYLSKERDSAMEFSVFNDLVRSITGLLVQSPGTSLIDTISIVEQPWRKMGLNRFGFQMMKNNITNSLGLGFGSFFQIFNRSIKFAHDDMAKMMEIGIDDATASLEGGFFKRLRTEFQSNMSDEMISQGMFGRGVETVSRGIRAFLETGIGSAEEGKGAFPVFRPQAIFSQLARQSAMANTMSTWKMYRNFIVNAAEYIQNHPEAMEVYKKHGMIFNEKALGSAGLSKALDEMGYGKSFLFFNNSKAYHQMYNTLLESGFNVEKIALDYINRKKEDGKADPLAASYLPSPNALYMALAHTTVSQVMMETDVTTRSPIFLTNGFAYAAMPLLGWSVQKFVDVNKSIATDRNAYGYLLGNAEALKAYMAILPIGLVYAYLRDEYDEEILGKKSSLQAGKGLVFKGDGMPSFEEISTDPYNALQVAIERLDRVGIFGFGGEFANAVINNESARDLSIDSRVYALNSIGTVKKVLTDLAAQRSANYATIFRPLASTFGGAGFLQYAQILNNGLAKTGAEPFFTQEYAMANRISTNNYLRAAGRYLDLDVRTFSGSRGITSTRMRPWVSEMLMAAVIDDSSWFDSAYQRAIQAASDMGKENPEDSVKRSFQAYHPLRYVFQTMPSEAEYYKLLESLNADGRIQVQQTIRNINDYGSILGISPSEGKIKKAASPTTIRSNIMRDLDLPSARSLRDKALATASSL